MFSADEATKLFLGRHIDRRKIFESYDLIVIVKRKSIRPVADAATCVTRLI